MFSSVYGVDFSGARLAGRTAWIARLNPVPDAVPPAPAWRLTQLAPLERLAGTAHRGPALDCLGRRIAASDGALWALGFPFGFPGEVMRPGGVGWVGQFRFVRGWRDDAWGAGVECLRRAQDLGGPGHLRRLTDRESRAPHDPYHYRVIYQTFHGMRDVLRPFLGCPATAILPFFYGRLPDARRVIVEACPASTLKRLHLPHQNYKQEGTARSRASGAKSGAPSLTVSHHGSLSVAAAARPCSATPAATPSMPSLPPSARWTPGALRTMPPLPATPRYTAEGRHYA
jgi:hypothetical protein